MLIIPSSFCCRHQLKACSHLSLEDPNRTVHFNDRHHTSRPSSYVQSSGRRIARQRMTLRWSRRALFYVSSSVRFLLPCLYCWLTFDFATASGRIKLAQSVLELLPAQLAGISEPEERATEYLHYRQFFVVWDSLERVVAFQALEVDMDISRIGRLPFPICFACTQSSSRLDRSKQRNASGMVVRLPRCTRASKCPSREAVDGGMACQYGRLWIEFGRLRYVSYMT
jgi:hypothetical protein